MSNSELLARTEMPGSNLELRVEPETGMWGTIIDLNLNADDDSDRDPHCQPDDKDLSSSKTATTEEGASIRMDLDQ